MNYRYYRGSEHSRETVEFDTQETTCVVNIDLLICGIKTFPCGNGDDIKLTTQERYDIFKFVEAERNKFIHKAGAKSMEDWENSGLGSFDEYFFPGDMVTEDVYLNFLNVVPPAVNRSGLLQVGEAAAFETDPETGKQRSTYTTFARANDEWWYAGECFIGETVNRRTRPGNLARAIAEAENELKTEEEKE